MEVALVPWTGLLVTAFRVRFVTLPEGGSTREWNQQRYATWNGVCWSRLVDAVQFLVVFCCFCWCCCYSAFTISVEKGLDHKTTTLENASR